MTLASQMVTDLSVFFETGEFGETVTYMGTPIPAIVEPLTMLDEATGAMVAAVRLTVKRADVPQPLYRDEVVITSLTLQATDASGVPLGWEDWAKVAPVGGAMRNVNASVWDVMRIEGGDSGVWTLTLYQNERPVV